jgi:hypothetical protein
LKEEVFKLLGCGHSRENFPIRIDRETKRELVVTNNHGKNISRHFVKALF